MSKKLRSIIAVLLSVLILTSVSVPAFAESEPQFELTTVNGEVGETVEMKLNINNNPGITALSVSVEYSAKDLELVSIESAGLFEDGISTGKEATNPMKISWYASDSGNKTNSGTFAVLKFRILENAESSDVKLSYNPENVFVCYPENEDGKMLENVTFATKDGKAYVGEMPAETTTAAPTETTEEPEPSTTLSETQTVTNKPTETVTAEPTESTTEQPTETATVIPTEPTEETTTQPVTDVTEPTTKATETTSPVTETTEPITDKPTEAPTESTTKATDAPETDPTETAPAVIRTFNFLPNTEQAKSADNFKLVIQDTKNNLHTYDFLTTENLIDGVTVKTVSVPLNYEIAQVQYQMYKGETWIGQIVKSAAEISQIGENIVKADGTVVNPNEPTTSETVTTAPISETTTAEPTESETEKTSDSSTTASVTEATEPTTNKPTEVTEPTSESTKPDFEYEVVNNVAVITKYSGSDTEVVIPSEIDGYKVTTIGEHAFDCCKTIEKVIISEGITKIESNAFEECEKLISVETPQSLRYIERDSFRQTPCFYSKNDAWYINDILMQYNGNAEKYTVEDGTRIIANRAFESQYAFSEITIPESVVFIGDEAFKNTAISALYGHGNSYADQYAKEHSIKLVNLDVVPTEPTTEVTEPTTATEPPTETETKPVYDEALTLKVGETKTVSFTKDGDWTATVRTDNEAVVKASIGQYSMVTFGGFVSKAQGIDITGLSVGTACVYVGGYSNKEYKIFVTVVENSTEQTNPTETSTDKPTEPQTDNPTDPTTDKPTDPVVTQPTTEIPTQSATEAPKTTAKKPNPIKVSVKKKTVKLKKLKKKAQKAKAITVKNAQGKVTYKLIAKGITKKIRKLVKISSKGVITIKRWKKAKTGDYKIKLKITAKGNKGYKKKTVTKTVKIRIE